MKKIFAMLTIPTPIGSLDAAFDAFGNLTRLKFVPPAFPVESQLNDIQTVVAKLLTTELDDYFAGRLRNFTTPIAPVGTPFQRRVWDSLVAIPYGQTATYGQIAKALGDANLSRAVGRANGANPIFVIIPCHRVIGANGQLTGYAGGLERKAELLKLESLSKNSKVLEKPRSNIWPIESSAKPYQ
jgi:methylated-DNA-[protein]-cysteine S-methyltransferase